MAAMPPEDVAAQRERFEAAGQGHVFRFWDGLDDAGRTRLLRDLASVPDDCLVPRPAGDAPSPPPPAEPAPAVEDGAEAAADREAGEQALARGHVAAVLLAGGEGTRLRHDGPKGTYPIGPASGKPLYRWFAEQLRARSRRAGRAVPLVVLTSPATHDATVAAFAVHERYGLAPEQVAFCRQQTRPVRGADGALLLRAPDALVRAPDGHGGLLSALARAGQLDALATRGVRHCFVWQVDNPLVKVCDPATIGRHVRHESDATSRSIEKLRPEEPHGVFCLRGGKLHVWEYTELPAADAARRDPDGRLAFRQANIAVHVLALEFLRTAARVAGALPWHVAVKPVAVVGDDGTPEAVTVPGHKEERFLFDLLPRARRPLLLAGDRAEWFAPAKSAEGEFSGPAARAALAAQHARWCVAARIFDTVSPDGFPAGPVEISPLLALDPDELRGRRGRIAWPTPVDYPLVLEPKG